jgi:ABC-2 type transport system permease protein
MTTSLIDRNAHWQLIQSQWLNLVRMPAYSIPTLLFPLMFYAFFGLVMFRSQAQWMLCTFATFGIMGTALFAFGVGIAMERAKGWWLLLRCAPAPFMAVLVGKAFGAMLFALIIAVAMAWMAALFADVRLPSANWMALTAVLVIGTLPFCLMGLALGLWLSPNAAPAVINLIYLPLGFLSGLWIPIQQLPDGLQSLAQWLPPYHLAGLTLHVSGTMTGPWPFHLLALVAYTLLFGAVAWLGWRRFTGA